MADVLLAVVRVPIPSANGTFDVTSSALGGLTPKAAIFFGGSYPSSLVGSPLAAHDLFQHVIGFAANGSNTYSVATSSDDNSANTNNWRRQDARPIRWIEPAAQTIDVSSWITNGIRLNLTTTDATLREMWCLLIAGDNVEAACNRIDLGTGTTPLVQTIGFEPDLVFATTAQVFGTDTNTSQTTALISYGVAHNLRTSPETVEYRWVGWGEEDNISSGGQPALHVGNTALLASMNVATANISVLTTVQDFNASGFSVVSSASALSRRMAYLAIYLDGKRANLFDFAVPTVSGQVAYTGIGFRPDAVLMCSASAQTINTANFNTAAAAGFALCGFDNNVEYAHSASADSAADPTNTKQITVDTALLAPNNTSPFATIANRASIDSDGFTLDYSTVSGDATIVWGLAIEGDGIAQSGNVRASQAAVLSGIRGDGILRVSQGAVLVGVKTNRPPCLTQEADCWRIERTDGVIKRFTSHSRALTFNGESYTPCNGASASALQVTAEAEGADNMDLNGILSTAGVSPVDIWNGLYEGATVDVYRVAWGGESYSYLMKSGIVGAVEFGDNEYRLEVMTANDRLAQRPVLSVVTPGCRWKFGSTQCGVDVAALAVTGAVTSLAPVNVFTNAHRRTFGDTSRVEANGRFTLGQLTWTSGPNDGLICDVKLYTTGEFVLQRVLPYPIELGDTYSATPGCDRLAATCEDTYANKINFGGFEFVRGTDDLSKTPEQDV